MENWLRQSVPADIRRRLERDGDYFENRPIKPTVDEYAAEQFREFMAAEPIETVVYRGKDSQIWEAPDF